MLRLRQQVSLRTCNSLAIDELAEYLVEVASYAELLEALTLARQHAWPVTLLGGGSNVLLCGPVPGLVIVLALRGRRLLQRSRTEALIEAEAGENWHQLVNWTLDMGLAGLENLSLIPGTVGAAPVQNIGAYGVELEQCLHSLDAYDRSQNKIVSLMADDCQFAYRDSLFKRSPGRFVILRVRLRLWPQAVAPLHIDYAPLARAWQATGLVSPDARVVSELVCQIRRSRLPDPAVLANAGSFFHNPIVSGEQAQALLAKHPALVHYPQAGGRVKLAAGWLIDQAGWKGYREGPVGVHAEQALVLVNHGGAKGRDILQLARRIQADIQRRYGLELQIEPQAVGVPSL
ncbi:UDP-N-acetylmuramate dehydrogenase [Halopseudomonas salegens]|uniref:UDP-N-acetylenolpyruvoylglucosamine reductase n=1 Tax=Halopseudomonas salegens TaxID=1434072 RepID=A0A1H2EZ94_9GAMM|nr:UDP-N-acetylmuramate dehydrogenase [Halopseudomonas salegens]SDU00038.1 UDP-N-acetylmuramate dehydrogenase [Halopseudomonas salegens]